MTIHDIVNNLIRNVENLTIDNVGNDSDKAPESDLQVQFAGFSAGISHQNLLIKRAIGTRQEDVLVLVPPTEPIIVANNQPDRSNNTGVIHMPHELKMPKIKELIMDMTL